MDASYQIQPQTRLSLFFSRRLIRRRLVFLLTSFSKCSYMPEKNRRDHETKIRLWFLLFLILLILRFGLMDLVELRCVLRLSKIFDKKLKY